MSVCLADACAGFVTEVYGPDLNWDHEGLGAAAVAAFSKR